MSRAKLQSSEKEKATMLYEMRNSDDSKLIITEMDDKLIAFLISGGKAESITVLGGKDCLDRENIHSNDLVIAYVRDVKPDIGAAFIEYAPGKDGYLPLNKLPKNMTLKQGDLVPVKLFSFAQKGKRATFTAKIDYAKYPDGSLLREKAVHLTAYSILYKDESFLKERLDKVFRPGEYSEIITDSAPVYDILCREHTNLRKYTDKNFGLSKLYSLKTILEEATAKKIWLKCGGYLYIEHTEAMTVVDVNSGKYTPSKGTDKESAYFSVNTEAAEEVCRQLRLRNISGIIVIDFINLVSSDDREKLLEILKRKSSDDIMKVFVAGITALGLVEMTRKKDLPPLYEQLG